MNQISVDDLIENPVKAIEVQYVAQTHEGDRLSMYHCDFENEAYMIEKDGSKVVSCIIYR